MSVTEVLRSVSFVVSGSPGCDESPADDDFTDVDNKTEEEDEAPEQDKRQSQISLFSRVLGHVSDGV